MCEHVWKEKLLDYDPENSSVIQIDKCEKCGNIEVCFSVASFPCGRRSYKRRTIHIQGADMVSLEGKKVKLD